MLFGKGFAKVLATIIVGSTSQIVINGERGSERGRRFPITQLVRQGCPLSPTLFIFAAHALIQSVLRAQEEGTIQGIKIPEMGLQCIIAAYADDTHFILHIDYPNLVVAKNILMKYSNATCLFIQWVSGRLGGWPMMFGLLALMIWNGRGKTIIKKGNYLVLPLVMACLC